jgi:hypothetical protein
MSGAALNFIRAVSLLAGLVSVPLRRRHPDGCEGSADTTFDPRRYGLTVPRMRAPGASHADFVSRPPTVFSAPHAGESFDSRFLPGRKATQRHHYDPLAHGHVVAVAPDR